MRRRFMNSKSFDENNYLTFVCLEDNSTIMFTKEIYYSINGNAWNKLYSNTSLKVTVGMHISFKGNFREIDTMYGIGYFITEGKFNILGNVNSLIFGDNAKNQTDISSYEYVFTNLFVRNTSIIDASLLKLSATTLASHCYDRMFKGCTSLTTAPSILPASTLKPNCYYGMFADCTSLTTAPELPATKLAVRCYNNMFYGCTSLTTAPVLPATTLVDWCYGNMFRVCTKLNYIKMLATSLYETNYLKSLNNWVDGVASTGTFVKNPAMNSLPTGVDGIPRGWTVVNDGEESGGKPTNCLTLKPFLNKSDINVDFSFDFPPTSDLTVNLSISNSLGNTTAQIHFWKDVQSGSKNSIGIGTSTEIQILSYEPAEDDTYIYEIIIEQ